MKKDNSEVKTVRPKKKIGIFGNTEFVILIATILIMVLSYIANNEYFSAYNMSTVFRQMSFVTIVAFGQTLVILLGDIDLSVGAVGCFTAICTGLIMAADVTINIGLVLLIGVCIGALCGLLNAVFITKFKITPFIITLATSQIFTGLVYMLTGGRSIMTIPESIKQLGQGMVGGIIPIPVIFMIVLGIVMIYVLKYTPFGRHIYAIGGNEMASRLVGIKIRKTKSIVYMISGVLSATAGMLMIGRLGMAQPTIGNDWVMPSITAAVLGGTSMSGGRGGVVGTIIGALLMTVISNAIVMMRISTYLEQVIIGSVVIVAVLIDSIRTRISRQA